VTSKTASWAIGITLLCIVLLSAIGMVLYGIALWFVETYSPD
jgi:hypothetical protein